MTKEIVDKRREILFLYDVTESNPNGDPDNENLPRMDYKGYNIVTDVRLKRTIRDYWIKTKKEEENNQVLVRREIELKEGTVLSMENLVHMALGLKKDATKKGLLEKIILKLPDIFLDLRCFGAAITVKGASHSFTGATQFGIGHSLNKPNISTHTITTTFASGEQKAAGTFGTFHVVDYSLILFHGLLCEKNAEQNKMTDDDLKLLYEGLWNGTKMLNTRSKFNHIPRLLLSVVSKEKEFQIGGLDRLIKIEKEEMVSSIKEAKILLTELLQRLEEYKEQIDSLEVFVGDDLQLFDKDEMIKDLAEHLKKSGFKVNNPLN
ncbi:MAG: type I-B CRISPR-associated protein Cas7/Csh2 [Candidatus Heimdallarchaeota archaeon]